MTCDTVSLDTLCTIKQICADTIYNISYDSLTVTMLEKAQTIYNSQFSNFTAVVSILTTLLTGICASLIIINFRSVKNSKKELSKIKKDFSDKFSEMEKYKNKVRELYRFASMRHYDLAMEGLKKDDYLEYFSNIYIYYYCITGINLTRFDSSHAYMAYKELSDKYENNRNNTRVKIKENESYFFMLIEYLLDFIKYCEENQREYFDNAKLIYNGFCNIYSDNGEDIVEGLKNNLQADMYQKQLKNF